MHPIPILLHCLGSMTSGMTDYKLAMLISGVAGATLFVLVPKANLGFADQTSVRTLFGFIAGLTIWHALSFLRIRIIRLLLSYDHWFIGRPNFIDYMWAVCLKLLLNSKNRGIRGYQDILPTLPVPSLKTTCRKFLVTVKPLVNEKQYNEAKEAVTELLNGKGPYIHRMLYFQSWRSRNWCSDYWLEYIYLRARAPLLINSNYFGVDSKELTTPHQLDRAAMRMYYNIKFFMEERAGKLPNILAKNLVPFCGYYVKYIFGCSRIPRKNCDEMKLYPDSRHIVVIRKGQYFRVTALDDNGNIMPPSQFKKVFQDIVDTVGDEEDNNFIAALTGQNRDVWAQQREILLQNPTNHETIHAIDSSLCICCLDDSKPETCTEIANDGFVGNGSNRWFDKGMNFIFHANGRISGNVEHTGIDATMFTQLAEYVGTMEEYDKDGHVIDKGTPIIVEPPTKLQWCFNQNEKFLTAARENYEKMVADSDLVCGGMNYGKRIPKLAKLSPDGWFQMAIQLAYYRIHKQFVLTYESATTRMFYKGRTETIRPVSDFSCKFARTFDDPSVNDEETKDALKKAIDYQEQYKLEAMRGLGIDRHFFGLYLIAKELDIKPFPKLFEHMSWCLPFTIATSQTPTKLTKYYKFGKTGEVGGFGTVTNQGYGISYIVHGEDTVNISVHSKKSCSTTDSSRMLEELRRAFDDMRKLYKL